MKKLWSALCGSALAASIALSSVIPVNAAPLPVPSSAPAGLTRSDVQTVDERRIIRRHDRRFDRRFDRRVDRREWRRENWRGDRGRHDGRRGWYNGHRGYTYYRPGYRRYGDFWYPGAAFLAGAVIAGALANDNPPAYSGGNAHVRWCYDRYRSYRASDNTFQPYNGPRRQCYSPYD